MANEWQKGTGLPFVFAAWIAGPKLKNREELETLLSQERQEMLAKANLVIKESPEEYLKAR